MTQSHLNQPYEMTLLPEHKAPSTRYQGSKEKIASWIWESIKDLGFDSFLDAFGGTGSVSWWAKRHGKEVLFNDVMRSNYYMGLAIIENEVIRLSKTDVDDLLAKHDFEGPGFIQETFRGIYFTDEENSWLDMIVANIKAHTDSYKRALALSALFQSCIIKRPYNLFHRSNLYMRLANVKRGFGNKATWDTPFETHFRRFAEEFNSAVFSNGRRNRALNLDVFEIPSSLRLDLVYIDPPYFSETRGPTDYYFYYHFLEGLCEYVEKGVHAWSSLIDHERKPKPLRHNTPLEKKASPWTKATTVHKAFDRLFERFKDSILVVSYNSEGVPSESQMVHLLRKYKRVVDVKRRKYRYALRPGNLDELLFIAT